MNTEDEEELQEEWHKIFTYSWQDVQERGYELVENMQVERLLELLLFWAVMLGMAYWFLLPLVKTLAILFAATVALVGSSLNRTLLD